ncbi:hypothetical protein Ndes2526B_g03941 [Nannochloris sp. 'desiccata']
MEVKVMVLVIDTATPSTAGATAENTNNTDFRAVLEAACASDTALQAKIAACAAGELPKSKKKKKLYQVHGSLLYKKCGSIFCLEVPTSMVPAVLREMHDSPSAGHMGVERTEYYNDPGPERDYARPGPDLINDEEFWPIVSFARNRWKRCKQAEGGYKEQFFVRWKDYPDSDNTWLDVGPLEAGMEAAGFAELLATLSTRVPMPTPAPQQFTIKKKSAAAAGPARVTRSKK